MSCGVSFLPRRDDWPWFVIISGMRGVAAPSKSWRHCDKEYRARIRRIKKHIVAYRSASLLRSFRAAANAQRRSNSRLFIIAAHRLVFCRASTRTARFTRCLPLACCTLDAASFKRGVGEEEGCGGSSFVA